MSEIKTDDEMNPEERLAWLRERGVQVEIPEQRHANRVANALREAENIESRGIAYVMVPADTSKPLKELLAKCPSDWKDGDFFLEHLKPAFSGTSDSVDLTLLQQSPMATLAGTAGSPTVSDKALRDVAKQANIEVFSLVHPTESNQYTGINIYLDEIGMLKRLPLNTRASNFALLAGYSPPPQFYGDVYLGRVKKVPGARIGNTGKPLLQHQSFVLGPDTDFNSAPWLKQAATDNLEYQMKINQITGRSNQQQPSVDGADGKMKQEDSFSWTQTDEELEVIVSLPTTDSTSKHLDIKFRPQSLQVSYHKNILVAMQLFERVEVDGCTWTIDRSNDNAKLIITMEKMEPALWPRIKD